MTWLAIVLMALVIGWLFMEVNQMAGDLDRIESELEELTSAGEGMLLLLTTLAAEIRANANSSARMTAIADKMDAKGKAWVEATLANTPEPTDGPPPEDGPAFKRK